MSLGSAHVKYGVWQGLIAFFVSAGSTKNYSLISRISRKEDYDASQVYRNFQEIFYVSFNTVSKFSEEHVPVSSINYGPYQNGNGKGSVTKQKS